MAQVPLSIKHTKLDLLAVAAALIWPGQAEAQSGASGWEVCNETSYIIEAATARHEGQGVTVQGWTRLRPGACE